MINHILSKRRNSKQLNATVILLMLTAVIAGCAAPAAAPVEEKQLQPSIKVEAVGRQSMGDPRGQVAQVSASVSLSIIAKASGEVVQIVKKNGDQVKEGDIIVQVDPINIQMEKERAESALRSAEQSLESSAKNEANSRTTLVNSIKSLEEQYREIARVGGDESALEEAGRNLDAAKAQLSALDSTNSLAALEAQVESSKLSLEQAQMSLDDYAVKAPADGVLTDFDVQKGMTIGSGTELGFVQNVGKMSIKAELSETSAELARNKKELVYYNSDNPSVKKTAKIIYLAELPSASTRLYSLELEAVNTDKLLLPGDRVQVELTTAEEENVIAVPALSIVREGGDTFVYILNNNVAEKRVVELGRMNGTYQEVMAGLAEGEQIVVSGQHTLEDGQKIETAVTK